MSLTENQFEELKAGGKLPSPSGIALRLIELTRQDDVALDEIARTVQADPALTGRLIRFSNSALNGPRRRPVVSVVEAIQRIGMTTVRQLVLGFSVMGSNRKGACEAFDYAEFWSRSLATAIAANAFCLRVRVTAAEESFTVGLLADVGSLALASLYPDEYALVLESTRDQPRTRRIEAEKKELGTDHAELRAALLQDWRIPRLFVDAVLHIDAPDASQAATGSRERNLVDLLALSASVGRFCVAEESRRASLIPALVLQAAKYGLDDQAMALVMDQVRAEWTEWGKILEVPTRDLPDFKVEPPNLAGALEPRTTGPGDSRNRTEALDVLVADDDRSVRTILEEMFRQQGHRVMSAADGKAALAMAVDHNPQLIVSDWMMPEMSGVELCQALRKSSQGAGIYFVLITGMKHEEELVEAFEAGVDDYVTKPFNPKLLSARLRASTRLVGLRREVQQGGEALHKFAAELALVNRRLQQAALTDALTALPNRQHIIERAAKERESAARARRSLVVQTIDLDRLGEVNEKFGYRVGDEVLRQTGAGIRQWARAEDIVGHLGNGKFLVLCPGANIAMGALLADRMRQSVANRVLRVEPAAIQMTVSIGVAEWEAAEESVDALMLQSEAALRRAKETGRNRVQVAAGGRSRNAVS